MNILFLADPNSIHDIKWISFVSNKNNCFLISRDIPQHKPIRNLREHNIKYVGNIKDYLTVKFWKNNFEAKKIKNVIQVYQIDIFHILYTEPNILWANYKHIFKIPIIASNRGSDILITINNTFRSRSLLNRFVSKRYRSAFEQCNWITCTSHSQIELIKTLNLNQNITVIRTGIDIGLIDAVSKNSISTELKKPYILFPRNMRPVYNHELALEAIKKLPASIKIKYQFIFIDADSNDIKYTDKIQTIIASIKDTKIFFLNKFAQSELFPLIKQASLAVMTNISDGSPVSAMEIMYLETPLILSPLQYDKELFEGISKFSNFDSKSLAQTIEKELMLPTKKSELSIFKNVMKNKCNRNHEMERLNSLYKRLIS